MNTNRSPPDIIERIARFLRGAASFWVVAVACGVLSLLLFVFAQVAIRGKGAVAYNLSSTTLYSISLGMLVLWCMWMFAAGRKKTVLFLRKFGNTMANEMVSGIIRSSLRGRARLFVLDDSVFPSVAISLRDRLGSFSYVLPFALATILFAFNLTATTGSFSGSMTSEDYWTGERKEIPSANLSNDKMQRVATNPLFTMPYAPFIWGWLAILSLPMVASGLTAVRGKRVIRTKRDLSHLLRTVRWATSWVAASRVMAPMMVLASSDDSIWREAVLRLIERCDFVIIDVTERTEHLQWELDACRSLARNRTILLAHDSEAVEQDDWTTQVTIRYASDTAKASKAISQYLSDHPLLSVVRTLRAVNTRPQVESV